MLANFRQSRLLTFVSYCLQSASIVLCYLPDFWSHWFVIPGGPVGKESTCSAGDWVLIPESGRSPGEGNGKPLQYFCLENPMDRGAWWAIVHGILRVGHDLAIKPQQFFSVISNLELSLVPLRLMILLWLLIQSHLTLRDPVDCLTPGFPVVHHLPELVQTHVHWVSDAIQPSHPVVLYSSCLQSFPVLGSFLVSQLFIWGGQSISFSISPSNEHPGLISFRLDWLALLAVQGTLKSPLQHDSSKASVLQHPAFITVQLSYLYMIKLLITGDKWFNSSHIHHFCFHLFTYI